MPPAAVCTEFEVLLVSLVSVRPDHVAVDAKVGSDTAPAIAKPSMGILDVVDIVVDAEAVFELVWYAVVTSRLTALDRWMVQASLLLLNVTTTSPVVPVGTLAIYIATTIEFVGLLETDWVAVTPPIVTDDMELAEGPVEYPVTTAIIFRCASTAPKFWAEWVCVEPVVVDSAVCKKAIDGLFLAVINAGIAPTII